MSDGPGYSAGAVVRRSAEPAFDHDSVKAVHARSSAAHIALVARSARRQSRQALRASLRGMLYATARSRLGGREHGSVLVIGHMRAGTSLAAHLLCGFDEVVGWGERNRPLADGPDLVRLAVDLAWRSRDPRVALPPPLGPRWLLDVINHDALLPRPQLLQRPDVRPIFLLREPQGALVSMAGYLGHHYGWTAAGCATAYVTRLATLAALADGLDAATRRRSRAIDFGELVADPVATLTPVAQTLGLPAPTSGRYPAQPWTGMFGDRSAAIRAGQVLSDETRHSLAGRAGSVAALDPTILARGEQAYARCKESLARLG